MSDGGDILMSYRTVRCFKNCHGGAPIVRKTQIGHVGGIAHSKMILKCNDNVPIVKKTQIGHVGGVAHSKMI